MENITADSNGNKQSQWQKFKIQFIVSSIAFGIFQGILALIKSNVVSGEYLVSTFLSGLLLMVFYFLIALIFAGIYRFIAKSNANRSATYLLALRITFIIAGLSAFFQLYESVH